jgi:CRISPR system Cascade subunit CasE
MFLSRLELRTDAAQNPRFWTDLQDAYKQHQAIWQLFADDPGRKRDFLFRKEGHGAGTQWYTLAERAPLDSRGFWRVESKPFEPRFEPGQRLAFMVRVNPTVAKAVSKTRSIRHDVVMDAKRRLPRGDRSKTESHLIREASLRWFRARAARNGFDFRDEEVEISGYRQIGGRGSKGIRLSTVDIDGMLTVQDPQSFTLVVFNGLGPAKAFGCGLMLVRRA